MLNVNRILIFLLIAIFNSSLYAVDVSNFDIKGIKLGMSEKQVFKKMPCSDPKIEHYYINTINGKKISDSRIYCHEKKGIFVELNHRNKVYKITRIKRFNTEPSWSKIKKQLLNHYGYTKNITIRPVTSNNKLALSMCMGGCKKSYAGYVGDFYNNKFYFLVVAYVYDNEIFLDFTLHDSNRENKNRKWVNDQEKLYKKQQKEKASNLDF